MAIWVYLCGVVIILQSIALYMVIKMHSNEDHLTKDLSYSNSKSNIDSHSNSYSKPKSRYHTPALILPQQATVKAAFGPLPDTDFSDLKYRGTAEIRSKYSKIFEELPTNGFEKEFKNPCWYNNVDGSLECLPHTYLLGFPKCGSSDLFERLKLHPSIRMPHRKEVRWFTRGEFTTSNLPREGGLFPHPYQDTALESHDIKLMDMDTDRGMHQEYLLGPGSSIYSFTRHFGELASDLKREERSDLISIDGGPHTIWWPTQSPDGTLMPEDVPSPQLIREIQPNAKFLITVADPVNRMYSDYYFLNDDLKPLRKGTPNTKSPDEFHERVSEAINNFKKCVEETSLSYFNAQSDSDKGLWFRASQICAHDRHKFSKGGHGRLGIGLYVLFIEKWLEHFNITQFKVVRLENYDLSPMNYMKDIFNFLELNDLRHEQWKKIVGMRHANSHRIERQPMHPETERNLRRFYEPYNKLLADLLQNDEFLWKKEDENRDESQHDHKHGNNLDLHLADISSSEQDKNKELLSNDPISNDKKSLRGEKWPYNSGNFKPKALDISGLPISLDTIPEFLTNLGIGSEILHNDHASAAHLLCVAAFTLNLASLKWLLYDVGVNANIVSPLDHERNAYHCLGMLYIMGDGGSRSQVFANLKGVSTWLTPYIVPPLNQSNTVIAREIIDGLEDSMIKVMSWLDRAGTDTNLPDASGRTPLHVSSVAGSTAIVKFLLERGADPNTYDVLQRSPLHYAAALGHVKILQLLALHGGDLHALDGNGNSAWDIVSNPGPISPEDALVYLNITQRKPRKIDRILNPELHPKDPLGWKHGSGGWSVERLAGFENDLSCDVDQYWAHEIDGSELYQKYLSHNAPVLIRGLINDWGVAIDYNKDNLLRDSGNITVEVSDIPYANKFGGAERVDMKLSDYIDTETRHSIIGGEYPWYIFRGHPIPAMSENNKSSLVTYDRCPTPSSVQDCISKISGSEKIVEDYKENFQKRSKERELFINAQWAMGGIGTGAPVHFHNSAWNALVYGAKKWFVFPPNSMIMSNKQIKNFIEHDYSSIAEKGHHAMSCVQLAGDVMIIPESWSHGVLNIQDSIAIATEAKLSMWRLKPSISFLSKLPFDNRKIGEKIKLNNRRHHQHV